MKMPACPKCGKPLQLGGTIGLSWKKCKACGFYKEEQR